MKKIISLFLLTSTMASAFDSGFILNAGILNHTATEESKSTTNTITYGSERTSSEWFPKMGFSLGAGYRFVFSNNIVFMPEVHYQSIGQEIKSNGYSTKIDSTYGFSLSLGYKFSNFLPYLKLQKHNKVKFSHSNSAVANGSATDYETGEAIGSGTDVVALGLGTDIALGGPFSLRLEYMHTKPLEYKYTNQSTELEQRITQDTFHFGLVFGI